MYVDAEGGLPGYRSFPGSRSFSNFSRTMPCARRRFNGLSSSKNWLYVKDVGDGKSRDHAKVPHLDLTSSSLAVRICVGEVSVDEFGFVCVRARVLREERHNETHGASIFRSQLHL